MNEININGNTIYYTDEFAKQCERLTVTRILDTVLPVPKGCVSCGKRREALKRLAFIEWINTHRHLSDTEIIERLKKMV